MSLKDAELALMGMGQTIKQNVPGPNELVRGFREVARPVWPIWAAIGVLLLFGEPFVHWLTH